MPPLLNHILLPSGFLMRKNLALHKLKMIYVVAHLFKSIWLVCMLYVSSSPESYLHEGYMYIHCQQVYMLNECHSYPSHMYE